MNRCVCINIPKDEVVRIELDLGEIYELLIIIEKINLQGQNHLRIDFIN